MCGGSTSGTPPTSVDTTSRPQQAASRMAMQNDSVKLVFRKIWPRQSTSLTLSCGRPPSSSTLPCKLCFSTSAYSYFMPSPSPPMIKFTFLNQANIFGIIPIKRSTPFLYANLDMNTILI